MSRWAVGRSARRTGLLGLSIGFHRKQRYSQLLLSSNKPMICLEDVNYDRERLPLTNTVYDLYYPQL